MSVVTMKVTNSVNSCEQVKLLRKWLAEGTVNDRPREWIEEVTAAGAW